MKKLYKHLLYLIIFELFVLSFLSQMNVQVQSWAGNAIGVFIFFLPIEVLLFLLGSDERFTKKKKICFKVVFWFIIVCYLLGGIAKLT